MERHIALVPARGSATRYWRWLFRAVRSSSEPSRGIFVFVILFEAFAVPDRLQHRGLFWGIIGALLLRGGAVTRFQHLSLGLALVLVFIGAKMILSEAFPIPIAVSRAVIDLLVGGSLAASSIGLRVNSQR